MSREKNGSRGTVKAVIYLLIVVILAGMVVYLTQSLRRDREPEITGTFIDSKLEAAGELTSAKMIYNGEPENTGQRTGRCRAETLSQKRC